MVISWRGKFEFEQENSPQNLPLTGKNEADDNW